MSVRVSALALCGLAACVGRPSGDTPDTDVADTDAVDTGTADTDAADTGVADTDPPPPACVLGTGESALVPLVADAPLTVTRGQQGRWHVFGAVSCEGVTGGGLSGSSAFEDLSNPDNPTVTWRLDDDAGQKVAGYDALKRPMSQAGDAVGLLGELLVFWSGSYRDAVGRRVTMSFHLVDKDAHTVDLSIPVQLVAEPGWVDTGDTAPP